MLKHQFSIDGRTVGDAAAPFVIAEMACAHEGEIDRAKRLIDASVDAGVDAVQLQIFAREHQVAPSHRLYPLLETLEFSPASWHEIYTHARQTGLAVFSFAYDEPSLQLALELGVDAIKLSSSDLSNPAMLAQAAASKLPVTLGTGASTLDEITHALDLIVSNGGTSVVLMHGVQNFPTAVAHACIRRIQLLKRIYGLPVGYQDHTDASLAVSRVIDLAALGMGACVLEKHVTLDRSERGTDYQAALEPGELKSYVATVRTVAEALGSDAPRPLSESDNRYRRFQKKKIMARHPIEKGMMLIEENTVALRCEDGEGISPMKFSGMIGRAAAGDLAAFALIEEADVL